MQMNGAKAMLSFKSAFFIVIFTTENIAAIANVIVTINKILGPNIRPNAVKSFISPPPMPPSVITARNKKTAKVIADDAICILQLLKFSIKLRIPSKAIIRFSLSGIIFCLWSIVDIFISNAIDTM